MSEKGDDDEEAQQLLLLEVTEKRNRLYESACRARLWEIGIPAFATLACVACLYVCEDCLLGVMLFCAALCFKDWVLVLVFFVSLGLFVMRHPVDTHTMHRVATAGYTFMQTE
jgi:hypothetical protein